MRVPLFASLGAMSLLTPVAYGAVTLTDQDLTLNFGLDVQERVQDANAGNAAGTPYDVFRGANGKSQQLDFNMRRARFLMNGSYGDAWKFNLSFNGDNIDRNGDNSNTQSNSGAVGANNQATNFNSNREVTVFKAYLERILPIDADDKVILHGGIDYPFFNLAIQGDPWWLFPQQRATGDMMGNRAAGCRVMASGTSYDWGADVMESLDPNKDPSNANRREGMFYSTRLQYTAFTDGKKPACHEDFQGMPGHSVMISADIALDSNDYGVANTVMRAWSWGIEAICHWDDLSALVEARTMHTKENNYNGVGGVGGGVNNSVTSRVLVAQAGYAIPAFGIHIEPALRFQLINFNTQVDESAAYNNGSPAGLPAWVSTYGGVTDRVNSGHQYDVGVNWIFTPYTMLQTAYTRWVGETGAGTTAGVHPYADIFRAQLQVAF